MRTSLVVPLAYIPAHRDFNQLEHGSWLELQSSIIQASGTPPSSPSTLPREPGRFPGQPSS
ncbi:protein of unknown function [Hyphomicrobium sp. 1Nfss2.1]